jgi:hypothetical protein
MYIPTPYQAIAACLKSLGIVAEPSELYGLAKEQDLDIGDPAHVKILVEQYAVNDKWSDRGTLKELKNALDDGHALLCHGVFARSTNLIQVLASDDVSYLVMDPIGKWTMRGYIESEESEIYYSVFDIARLLSPESEQSPRHIWMHVLSKVEE